MRRIDFWTTCLRRHSLAWGMTTALSVCTLVGCGRSNPTSTASQEGKSEEEGSSSEPSKAKKKSDSDAGQRTAPGNSKGPMVGDIPLNVFFDNPIAVSNQAGEVATPASAAVAAAKPPAGDPAKPAADPMPAAEKPAATAAGGDDWGSIVTAEDLQGEVKKIRLRLQDHLSAIGKYNSHYNKEIRWDGSALAALAAIALVHPEKVSWKANAGQIRDVASEMVKKAKGLGAKPFEETKKEFDKIDGLLGGNPPADLPAAAADVTFSDVASRKNLMNCIQEGSDYLRANFQAAAKFEKDAEDVAHTASIIAAYSKVVGTDGYNSADEDDYKAFLKPLLEANLTMLKAARDKDFEAFTKANGPVPKYCSDCHTAYAGNTN